MRIVERLDRALRAHAAAPGAAGAGHRGRVAGGARRVLAHAQRDQLRLRLVPDAAQAFGLSGFRTIEAGLRARGPWTAAELNTIETREVAETFGQDPEHELMALFTRALRELGDRITVEYFGRFLGLVNSAEGSAERLAETLATWPTWRDISHYEGEPVPFYKRAQIAAADLHLAGIAPAEDLDRLTLFADNLVPHVLRLDGVLEFDERLVGAHRRGLPARARLARGGRDPRLRAERGRAAGRGAPRPQRDGRRQHPLEPREPAAVQGAAPPPRPHHGVLGLEVRVSDPADGVDRDREADAAVGARLARDLGVDPDHLAGGVEQRAARVAGVDRRVGLDDAGDRVAVGRLDVAVEGGDDARGQRAGEAEGRADRDRRLADAQAPRSCRASAA